MGKNDIAVRKWLSDKERFSDVCNAVLFGGEKVVLAEDLERADSESAIIITDKKGKSRGVKRYRDIVMRWKYGAELVLLACENQDKIHYAMPVRNMIYDGLAYAEQIDRMWQERKKEKETVTEEEFLSRMKKDDKLNPVITLVFYYGEKEWDGSRNLHEMFRKSKVEGVGRMISKYIPDYHINLIDASEPENLHAFHSDLQLILGMLQYRDRKEALVGYVNEHREYFSRLDIDTYRAVQAFLNSETKLKRVMKDDSGKERIDMCKALRDLYEEGVDQGIEKGIEKGIKELIMKKYKKGVPIEEIADFVEMPYEKVRGIAEESNTLRE